VGSRWRPGAGKWDSFPRRAVLFTEPSLRFMIPIHSFDSLEPATGVVPGLSSVSSVVAPMSLAPEPRPRLGSVLHLINGQHFAGAERVQQLLGRRLPELGIDATFACLKPGKFPAACGLSAERVIQVPMRGRFDVGVAGRLAKLVVAKGYDLLHAHTPRTALIASMVARRTGTPWVYHVHSPTARDSTRGLVNRINAWIERYALSECSHVVTVSNSLREEMLAAGVEASRLSVIPNGVPAIEPIDRQARMEQYGWRLGLVALMRPRKGVEIALQAMAAIKMNGLPIKLELIGSFETLEYESQIYKLIKQLHLGDVVSCMGFTSDIPSALHRLDALLLPSLFGEGMPMVVLEALSAGVPVIATSVEGTPEVVRQGVEGMLAEPRSAQSLTDCIVAMTQCREDWREMSVNALKRHRESYSDSVMAERTVEVYKRLMR
jgi:glycosyltransferase involved in cell wall biosynthesis